MSRKLKSQAKERAARRRDEGRIMRAFEISVAADRGIDTIAGHLSATGQIPACTRTQAVDVTLQEAAKKILKNPPNGLDTD